MDFTKFNTGGVEEVQKHKCEIIVVDFQARKEVLRVEALEGEIAPEDQEKLNSAFSLLKAQKPQQKAV